MRQYVGTILFAAVGIIAAIIGWFVPFIHSSWRWWLFIGIIATGFLVATYLSRPDRQSPRSPDQTPRTAFIRGDADGSVLRRVESNADDFISGNARRTFFGHVRHNPHR
jgi:MFS family permease